MCHNYRAPALEPVSTIGKASATQQSIPCHHTQKAQEQQRPSTAKIKYVFFKMYSNILYFAIKSKFFTHISYFSVSSFSIPLLFFIILYIIARITSQPISYTVKMFGAKYLWQSCLWQKSTEHRNLVEIKRTRQPNSV